MCALDMIDHTFKYGDSLKVKLTKHSSAAFTAHFKCFSALHRFLRLQYSFHGCPWWGGKTNHFMHF